MLTPPALAQLYSFWGSESPVSEEGEDENVDTTARMMLQAATDLAWFSTSIDEMPTDARQARMLGLAILDMGIYLFSSREDVSENYSPFTSETIGSYSYSKSLTKASLTGTTGVQLFDLFVSAVLTGAWDPGFSMGGGEHVFTDGFRTSDRSETLIHSDDPFGLKTGPDPGVGTNAWILW